MRLLGNKAIVHMPPMKSTHGIIIPSTATVDNKASWKRGIIVALGVNVRPECNVKVGDVVLFQMGFDVLDKDALGELSKDDLNEWFAADGELWIGNPDNLFSVIQKNHVKRQTAPRGKKAAKK